MVELAIGLVLLAVVMGVMMTTLVRSSVASLSNRRMNELTSESNRALHRIGRELVESSPRMLSIDSPTPSGVTFKRATGFTEFGINWGPARRLELAESPTDPDDGVDNDNDGMVDERQIVLTTDVGGPNEATTTLLHGVAKLLEGEMPNGLDDNGNGLIDESGLCFVLDGDTVTIRLTLQSRRTGGSLYVHTVETAVGLRN